MHPDPLGRRALREARHRQDFTRERHDKPGTRGWENIANLKREPGGRAELREVIAERILRLGHTDRSVTKPHRRKLFEGPLGCGSVGHTGRAINACRDGFDLLTDGEARIIEWLEPGASAVEQPQYPFGHR